MTSAVYVLLALVAAALAAPESRIIPAPESRIVGGTPTVIEDYPFMVTYLYSYPVAGITVQRCVGCLISSWHVLTSGFCFTGAVLQNMQLRAGSTSSLVGGTLVNVNRFVKHDDYVETPRAGDLAVTFLDRALGISNTINILYLPPALTYIPDGTAVRVVSWGFEYEGGPQLELLKTVDFNKINVLECQDKYADRTQEVTITESVICGAASGVSMCLGDSGAPMVINNVIVGISSYFESCTDEYPSVFARVDRYTNWILEVASSA